MTTSDRTPLERIVIVGGSLAGWHAATALRSEGYRGEVVMISAERHLPYDRPPLSKEYLAGEWSAEQLVLPGNAQELGIDMRLGVRATGLDPDRRTLALSDGETVHYDGAIIATGASPRRLPGVAFGLARVHELRTLEDADGLRRALVPGARVVVVGAGFIGSEVAATAIGKGCNVTIIEAVPVPMVRVLGSAMGAAMAQRHRRHGVTLELGVGVAGIADLGEVTEVTLADGRTLAADVVVVGIGAAPVTDWLDGALKVGDGILCDDHCATSAPGVYAAGDVARWDHPELGSVRLEHWTNASDQARAAAANLLAWGEGAPGSVYAPVPFVWSDQYEDKIQMVGHPGADDEVAVLHGDVEGERFCALYRRGDRLSGALTVNWPRLRAAYRRILERQGTWQEAVDHARANPG